MDKLIQLKQQSLPFQSTGSTLQMTDTDCFPYTRFFRGEYNNANPVIFDREVGWRPRCQNNYTPKQDHVDIVYPNHCFQGPVTTVYPCMAEYERKYSDKKAMDLMLFRTRV